jgi:hypothetical protein
MSYYPLFNILDAKGFVNLANFSPNNWEIKTNSPKEILSYTSNGKSWDAKSLGKLSCNEFKKINLSDLELKSSESYEDGVYTADIALLQLRNRVIDGKYDEIPLPDSKSTQWPEWRATIGFNRNDGMVSYQGEINATPPKATLLTFHPFIQYNEAENFLVFVNMEKSPVFRWANLYIFNSSSKQKIATLQVRNNSVNVIPLDQFKIKVNELPVFYCDAMAGIPFGFARGINNSMLSLEHTHPPGSMTLFGDRFVSQKYIKTGWTQYIGL